jgi:prepilin-type N-terminal cleavage/methylation domain-containing protein/prepilin-type processing-associated H-X9-DG protein
MSHKKRNQFAFTLIELLVVITIISLLAAILFPVFGRARENSRRASCQSNLKQIALGLKQYTQDYDERFPIGPNAANTDYTTGWAGAIQPYVKSVAIFQCPSDDDKSKPTTDPLKDEGHSDYWYNAALSWNGDVASPNYKTTGLSEAALLKSSLTILASEGDGNNFSSSSYRANGCTVAGAANAVGPAVDNTKCDVNTYYAKGIGVAKGQGNHLSGFNLAYTDGHVKWQRMYEESGNQDSATATIYNVRAGFQRSGNSPTFNATSETDR